VNVSTDPLPTWGGLTPGREFFLKWREHKSRIRPNRCRAKRRPPGRGENRGQATNLDRRTGGNWPLLTPRKLDPHDARQEYEAPAAAAAPAKLSRRQLAPRMKTTLRSAVQWRGSATESVTNGGLSRALLAMTSHNIGEAQRRLICGGPSGGPTPQGGALRSFLTPPLYFTERCAK